MKDSGGEVRLKDGEQLDKVKKIGSRKALPDNTKWFWMASDTRNPSTNPAGAIPVTTVSI